MGKVKTVIYLSIGVVLVAGAYKAYESFKSFNPIAAIGGGVYNTLAGFWNAVGEAVGIQRPASSPSNPYGLTCPPGYHPTIFGECVSDDALHVIEHDEGSEVPYYPGLVRGGR